MESTEIYDSHAENAKFLRKLASTEGHLQSPIDLDISYMHVIDLDPLHWVNCEIAPRKLKITNTGYTVILSAQWQRERFYITGSLFETNYVFSQAHFHWGENAMKGSEHTIDGASMPMELHAVLYNKDFESLESALLRDDGVIILIYFFKNEPNEFMDQIVKNLAEIRTAHSSVRILPMKLTKLTKPFEQDYFIHWGSIITINNIHKMLWLTSREPIGISVEQIAEFRTLKDGRGMPILSNLRPLHDNADRHVFHVYPSGKTYASLCPLPRDFAPEKPDGTTSVENVTAPESTCSDVPDVVKK